MRGEIEILTAKYVRALPYAAVSSRAGVDQATWDLISANLSSVAEAKAWLPILDGQIDPIIEDPEFIAQALDMLPQQVR